MGNFNFFTNVLFSVAYSLYGNKMVWNRKNINKVISLKKQLIYDFVTAQKFYTANLWNFLTIKIWCMQSCCPMNSKALVPYIKPHPNSFQYPLIDYLSCYLLGCLTFNGLFLSWKCPNLAKNAIYLSKEPSKLEPILWLFSSLKWVLGFQLRPSNNK